MEKYIAITIGPIYKTLSEAKKTRAVWAASYFFSWFMRSVIEESIKLKLTVILPYSGTVYKGNHGAGFYTDRAYFLQDEVTTPTAIKVIIEGVFASVEKMSNGNIPADFLRSYINLHVIDWEITETDYPKAHFLEILNNWLDNAELKKNAPFDIEENPLQKYFLLTPGQLSFLASDAFGASNKQRHFRSIPEISTTSLQRLDSQGIYQKCVHRDLKNDEADLFEELQKEGFPLLPHHKYYAVLYADGDNIGKLLSGIGKDIEKTSEFSRQLFEFGILAEKEIAAFGGNGIYLGGEDVLAFLPIVCLEEHNTSESQSFWSLLKKLDIQFDKTVGQFARNNQLPVPTMSYGINISYIKHPLKESLQTAYEMLHAAKEKEGKNAAGIVFRKHSGQTTTCIIEKNKTLSLDILYKLTEKYTVKQNTETEEILSSIIHKFNDILFYTLFFEAVKGNRLDAMFDNYFNEELHIKGGRKNEFLMEVKKFSETVATDYINQEDCSEIIFTTLKLIHFINSKRE